MAVNVQPGGFAAAYSAAPAGETLILQPGEHTLSSSMSKRIIIQASDWAVGKVVTGTTGHNGSGMAVKIIGRQQWNASAAGSVVRGCWMESSNALVASGSHLCLGAIGWEDCVFNNRTSGGTGMICLTWGDPGNLVGVGYAKRCRFHKIGSTNKHHALYIKHCDGAYDEDCLFYDISGYSHHFYGNPRNYVGRRFVTDRTGKNSAGGVVFSGDIDSTTGFSGCFYTRDCILENAIITNTQSASPYAAIESNWGCTVGTGNIVRNTNVNQASGLGPRIKGGGSTLAGVSLQNLRDVAPLYADPTNGDFTLSSSSGALGLGPTYIQPGGSPPPPPLSPTFGTPTPGDTQIALSWTNPSAGTFTEVVIRRGTTSFPTLSTGTEVYRGTDTTYTDTDLTNDTEYRYSAWAHKDGVYSLTPSQTLATPAASDPPDPPDPPTDPTGGAEHFGKTTVGAVWRGMSGDYKRATSYTVPAGKQITAIVAYLRGNGTSGTQSVRPFAYNDATGALLGVCTAQDVSNTLSEQWVTFTPSSAIECPSNGGLVRLGLHTTSGDVQIATDIVAGSLPNSSDTYSDGTESTWTTFTTDQYQLSIFALIEDVAASTALSADATLTFSSSARATETPARTPVTDVAYRMVTHTRTFTVPIPFQVSTGIEVEWDGDNFVPKE